MRKLYQCIALLFFVTGLCLTDALAQSTFQVKGKVTSVDGPLPGVSIKIKETTSGTTSDVNGDYALDVSDRNAILVFSYIGFVTEEVPLEGRTTVDIMLSEDILTLSEIVVIGYGTDSKKTLSSSITTVKTEELNRGAISDIGQLLQGKVAGLNISRSGDPNREAAIIMRGASTLRQGAQSPLFVIDGVIGADISLIAPDDIESIDVMKDASATAIYGNRAANGVILITTRRPDKGAGKLTYSGYVATEKVSSKLEMMDANQLRDFLAQNGSGFNPGDDLGVNTNWQDEVQRSAAISHNHNLSLTGGSDKTAYIASLNYYNQQGIIKESGLKRIIAKIGVDQSAFRDKLKLGFTLSNSFNTADYIPYRNTVLSQMITYLPTVPVRNTDGSYFIFPSGHDSDHNPVAMIENAVERNKYNILLGTFKAELQLPLNLKYNMQASYQNKTVNNGKHYNSYFTETFDDITSTPDPPDNPSRIQLLGIQNGFALRNTYQYTNVIFENFLSWDKEIGNSSISAVAGYSWQENTDGDGFQVTSTNFQTDEVGYNNLVQGDPYANPLFRIDFGDNFAYGQVRLVSDFARLKYTYNNRYIAQLSFRRDGSSAFGANHRFGYFPSASLAWRISEENFMSGGAINDLKLRASYGTAGNSFGFNAYTTKLLYGPTGADYVNGVQVKTYNVIQNENPDLRWEKTSTANIGVDFSIFSSRITGSVDVYEKTTTDLIYTYDVAPQLYLFSRFTANVGEIANRGIEVSLNAEVVKTSDLSWNTGLNLASNRNEVVSLSNDVFQKDTTLYVTPNGSGQSGVTIMMLASGQPIGTFFTLNYAGRDENGVSQYLRKDGSLVTNPATLIPEDDYVVGGNAQPKLLLGWNNNLRYKNFDLNLFFRGVFGNKIFNATRADLFQPSSAQRNNILVEVAAEPVSDGNSNRYSTRFIEKGDYIRLDNATLGYNFKGLGQDVKALRIYTSINNMFVITKYKGIDPEINQGGLGPGVDARNFYPKTRTFLIGVSATF